MTGKVGVRINIPYLQGAYLGLNAIPDAYFLGDGPSCIFDKAAHIHGRHDLFSTLLSCDSEHRVQHTGVNVFNIAGDCEGGIAAGLRRIAGFRGCGAIFLGSMPMCAIVGTDYERILRDSLGGIDMPAFIMPRRSAVSGDWLDGYAAIMEALAAGMDLDGAKPEPATAALVGYMMDRNEGDHLGNLRELERIFAALDIGLTTIWLSGRPYESLRDVRRAGKIVSLPYGRKAAAILGKRLGAPVIEAGLPFGLEATRRFVELLGREFGREEAARAFIARELDAVVPKLQWTVPHAFFNRRFAFSGDPHLAERFVEQIEALGGRLAGMIVVGGDYHLSPEGRRELARRPGAVFEPLPGDVSEQWGLLAEGGVDLVVGSAFAFVQVRRGRRWMEFGYPSEETHFLRDEPFLGFQGALGFLSRMANEVSRGLNEEPDGR
ncbi:MAG: nitrogenase component 1 [Elusimicrobiota bacterium]|nr:nitrogenase component 1 [Elusimicrobiota bacterium]